MPYGAGAFITLIEAWMRDARFHQIVRYGQERHWLSATGLRETNHSDILAWLLDPEEGHGLGDFFLRRLLVEATTADDNVSKVAQLVAKGKWPGLAELFADGLHGFQVGREVPCGEIKLGKRVEKGYLDLLLLNRQRKLAVLIERKASRLAHDGQLAKYESWLNEHLRHYRILKIVSDTGLVDQSNARDRQWLVVDDDWLLDGLQAAVKQNRAPDRVCQRLMDYLATVQWTEDADPYYAGIEADLDAFAASHSPEIKKLRAMKLLEVPVRQINVRRLMGEILPDLAHRKIHSENKAAIEQACELAARYWSVIDAVLDRSSFNALEDSIKRSMPNEFAFWQRRLRSGEQEMWISPAEYGDRDHWPIVLQIRQVEGVPDEQSQQSRKTRVRIRLHSRGFSEEERELGAPTLVLQVFNRRQTSHENITLQTDTFNKADVTVKDLGPALKKLRQLADAAHVTPGAN